MGNSTKYELSYSLIKCSCYVRPGLYEVGGVLGVSFATNLLSSYCTHQSSQVFSILLFPMATVGWFIFGILCFIYAYHLRRSEKAFIADGNQKLIDFVTGRMSEKNKMKFYCIGIFISFFLSFLFIILAIVYNNADSTHKCN